MLPKIDYLIAAHKAGELPEELDPLDAAKAGLAAAESNPSLDDQDRLVRYLAILETSLGKHISLPACLGEPDEFDLAKRKLERRIAELAGDPNAITVVAERYYKNNQIKPGAFRKYRGNVRKLTSSLGDIAISHVTSAMLRRLRDQEAESLQPPALASVCTPIRGMFTLTCH